jgi:predicted lipid-binding transport protein (Tim44 family)
LECQLTTLFSDTTIQAVAPIDARPPRKKRGWLPLLTVLFCLSYGLMTMLIVEQGATIESQRALIQALFHDSTELSATKMKALREKRALHAQAPGAKAQDAAPSNQASSNQASSNQAPSTQAQNQAPSSQAAPVQNPAAKGKSQFRMPSRPAADISDSRRTLITI